MTETYKKALVNNATRLDAVTESGGEITKLAVSITEQNDRRATVPLLQKISDIIHGQNCRIEVKHLAQVVNSDLISYYGYITLQTICKPNTEKSDAEDKKSLCELQEELDSLVGLEKVKGKVNDLISYQKVQQLRRKNNLHAAKSTLHMAFTGNPGTGKTTVARIVGRIYKQLGLLSSGHFIEVSRTDLIAGYQGQTALKVKNVIERAKGGVLFIDEAYSITETDHSDSYGRECLTELTKALEDYRDDLVVIVAGYTAPMKDFFNANPGLKSRFNTFIEFPDYSAEELEKILLSICQKNDYLLDESAQHITSEFFEQSIAKKNANFSNGRFARNIYDDLVMNHARRVVHLEKPTRKDLCTIIAEDFHQDCESVEQFD